MWQTKKKILNKKIQTKISQIEELKICKNRVCSFFFTSLHQHSESIRLSQMLLKTELHILHQANASEGKINVLGAIVGLLCLLTCIHDVTSQTLHISLICLEITQQKILQTFQDCLWGERGGQQVHKVYQVFQQQKSAWGLPAQFKILYCNSTVLQCCRSCCCSGASSANIFE